jgi:hypothetical protein
MYTWGYRWADRYDRPGDREGKVDLSAFYGAFSPACFALLGLWLVAVQIRLPDWEEHQDSGYGRRSYGVALQFALPGLMSVLALVDLKNPDFWRASFVIVGLGGAVIMVATRGFPVPPGRGAAGVRGLPGADRLGLAAFLAAIVLYVLIAALALVGGGYALRTEAVLQTTLVFLGFNVAWLLLLGARKPLNAKAED